MRAMFQPKIPMIVLFFLLIFNAIPMIFSPVEFDKDYIENGTKVPSTQEGSVYEGLVAHNKAGLGAALAGLAIVLLMHINSPQRIAKRVFLSVGLGVLLLSIVVGQGGARGFVDTPPVPPLIIGAMIGLISILIHNSPDVGEFPIHDEEE